MGEDFNRCDLCRAKLCGFSPPADLTPTTALLPCLHAFCPSCKTKCEQASLNHQTLVCQVCRTECLRSHVLNLPNTSDCSPRRCESTVCPDKHQATTKCIICNEALCADCSLAHQRVTATSSHFLQSICPVIPKCVRCRLHSNMKIVSLCQCGSYLCMTCVASRLHDGPSHMITPLSHLPNAHIDESKIMSSTARETTHIDCSLSMIQVRKNTLSERVANLKKEVGNQVVHICQAVMRRGNDLLRALDSVQFYKAQEYDKLRNELLWQKRRFSRINSYASHIKDFEDLTTLVVMRQFLENCIIRSLNGLQRPATVQFKSDTEHVLANISQWGRIFAEVDDLGTLKTGIFLSTNIYAQRSCPNGLVGPSTSNPISLRPPVPQDHSRLLQQQQFHVQELAARQIQNVRRQGFPQSQFFGSLLTESSQRPGSIQLPGPHRYPGSYPYAPGMAAPERPYVSPYTLPAGQSFPYASQRMFLPSSMPTQTQQPPTSNLAEAYNSKIPNVQLTSSQSESNLSGTSFASGAHTNSLLKRSGESLIQTNRIGIVNSLSISSSDSLSTLSFAPATQSTSSSSASTTDTTQSAHNSSTPIVCSQNADVSAQHDRSDVALNSLVSNLGVTTSTQQKCALVSSGTSAVLAHHHQRPRTSSTENNYWNQKSNNDEMVKLSNICKIQLDQEQLRTGTKHQCQASSSADNDESRWDDYCYVCQQGCDEKTGSLGCCARCPRVFHNICHIPAIKEQMEKLPDEWACSLCIEAEPLHENEGTIGQQERLLCSKVLLSCYEKHLDVEPFCQPVPRTVISYHVIIKQPMDFSTIARRLKEKSKDAFTNPGDEVAKAGRSVYQIYSRAVKEYLPCMKSQNAQSSSSTIRVHETSAEPVTKKPRKEVKSEFSEFWLLNIEIAPTKCKYSSHRILSLRFRPQLVGTL
ncbi:hypothetical protein DINM_021072 [Dirofilaria immitis]|nr:hypothetical protein [Dirofilaria immitis]